ncbi:MAG: hypothetical protein COV74_05270 [Candidatus Omnitrophica bacterium CG11_big_fil_rev_8_21_14_0_20_45_26]|uniref:Uncharacterized protein n=1 Tax=Candidatus Abzuiibacterium crystallinum TaxID=1974748 RepID=A0A2H0LPK5_9BACT|nr:MAG: hypothetical protein COV74_05270 [Candidatus Omnitrophica bacterium CG11_big_fil_rev_8_21_14_0_20_45_26]PIW64301.1 MAG: hypothetical protein COW12_06590 [Candidatus Omnitrophica bacterium CG12_big_fil_rev_8_21_14_0_65_45_16]
MADLSAEKSIKIGLKIAKPQVINIHPIYVLMAAMSFALIGLTLWLLVLEYMGQPPFPWLRSFVEDLTLSI